jgi:hypothetical protein
MKSSIGSGGKNLINKNQWGLAPPPFFLSIEKEKDYFTRQ